MCILPPLNLEQVIKSSFNLHQVASKLSDEDKKAVVDKCNEGIAWIDSNQTAEKDEFEDKKKEIEGVCAPIISKLYAGTGGGAPDPSAGTAPSGGPTVEEVD